MRVRDPSIGERIHQSGSQGKGLTAGAKCSMLKGRWLGVPLRIKCITSPYHFSLLASQRGPVIATLTRSPAPLP